MDVKLTMFSLIQEPCESGGGRPGLPVPNGPYGLSEREAATFYFFHSTSFQALGEGCRLQNTACSLVSNVTRPTESGVATLPHTHILSRTPSTGLHQSFLQSVRPYLFTP